jgi:hypothetical protein
MRGLVSQVMGNVLNIGPVDAHGSVPAAIRASRAVNLMLYLGCENLKRLSPMMMGREIPAEVAILGLL